MNLDSKTKEMHGNRLEYYINLDGTITFSKQEHIEANKEYDNTISVLERFIYNK